ncbi:MAG: hypothetical protein V3V01_12180 [Acidimicrobiales bacterium]
MDIATELGVAKSSVSLWVRDVEFANTSSLIVRFYCRWLRAFFQIDNSRLRIQLYLHEGLDLESAIMHWEELTGIPRSQFSKPYRAVADPSIRKSKHEYGCPHITYSCVHTHRQLMGLMNALLSSGADHPG